MQLPRPSVRHFSIRLRNSCSEGVKDRRLPDSGGKNVESSRLKGEAQPINRWTATWFAVNVGI